MPFIAPFIPGIASGIGLLLGGGGGNNANLHQQQNAGLNLFNTGDKLIGSSGAPLSQGLNTLGSASSDINQANSFFRRLLGSQPNEMQALSPEINAITSQYDASRRMRGALAPRGGGATAGSLNSKFNEIGDIGNLLSSARSNAASGLLSGGSALAGVGSTQAGIGLNQLNAGVGAEEGSAGIYNNAQQQVNQGSSSFGEGLGTFLGQMFPNTPSDLGNTIIGLLKGIFGGNSPDNAVPNI